MCRFQTTSVHPDNTPNRSLLLYGAEESFRLRCPLAFALWHQLMSAPMREKNSFVTQEVLGEPRSVRSSGNMPVCDMPWFFSPVA